MPKGLRIKIETIKNNTNMSREEILRRQKEMREMAAEYTARTGKPVSKTWLAAIETQGCITINDPAFLPL